MNQTFDGSAFEQEVAAQWLGRSFSDTRKLLAVSGGADSVALFLALLKCSPEKLEVAHFNHGWRGAESDADARFCEKLCQSCQVPFHLGAADTSCHTRSEATARNLRYEFLEHTAYRIGARCVVTAHTANDRVETALHNLFRGTGLAGIASMSLWRSFGEELLLVRPLLTSTRADVEQYLKRQNQAYREDSSNEDTSFKRNFLRRELIPAIETQYGRGCQQRILQLCDIADQAERLLERQAKDFLSEVASADRDWSDQSGFRIPSCSAEKISWPVLQKALTRAWAARGWPLGKMTQEHWRQIRERLFNGGESKRTLNLPGQVHSISINGHVEFRGPNTSS